MGELMLALLQYFVLNTEKLNHEIQSQHRSGKALENKKRSDRRTPTVR